MTGRPAELCFLNFKGEKVKLQRIKSRNEQRLRRSWGSSNLQRENVGAVELRVFVSNVQKLREGVWGTPSHPKRVQAWKPRFRFLIERMTVNAPSLKMVQVFITNASYREVKLWASPRPELGLASAVLGNQYFESVSYEIGSFHDQHLTGCSRMLLHA